MRYFRLIMNNNISTRIIYFLIGVIITISPIATHAFSLSKYSENSVLNEGRWVKISVPNSGVYMITNEDLQKWGFSNPSKVHIYGYGGKRMSDNLTVNSYIDDLPIVQSKTISRGIVFYAQGAESWERNSSNRYTHILNPFSSVGYYLISDREVAEEPTIEAIGSNVGESDMANATTSFTESLYHETNLVNHGETGHLLLGEDFKYTPSQTFKFDLTDIVPGEKAWMQCQFAAKTYNTSSLLTFTANGLILPAVKEDNVPSTSVSAYVHGKLTTTQHIFDISSNQLSLGIKISSQATIQMANLDHIVINYTRKLKLANGSLKFRSLNTLMALECDNNSTTQVWDITNPQKIYSLNTTRSGNSVLFRNDYTGLRNYVAWNENATLPSPSYVGTIANQNIHALPTPEMVIFAPNEWIDQANRLADIHRNSPDSLKVEVFSDEAVYNEFSSGTPDINAYRKLLKMFWDRGESEGTPLKYALMFGRGSFDNQHLTNEMKSSNYVTLPLWETDKGLDDNESFCSDDILAFLKDNSGSNMGTDHYCIGVGRIPARTANEAKNAVDKIATYINNSTKSEWKNQMLVVADDMDNGVHMEQAEEMINIWNNKKENGDFLVNKIYIDAFTREGITYPQAKAQMFRLLNEGVVWWTYIGHANTTSWTHDGLFSYTEMSSLYLKNYPFLYAATCDYMRWDANATSGAEVMNNLTDGGTIGTFSATRPVYIANNGLLSNALAPYILARDNNGKALPLGDIVRNAKNNLRDYKGSVVSDRNKLRYALMGDPALRLAVPASTITVSSINGALVEHGEEAVMQARQNSVVKGYITDFNGKPITDFNGVIHSTLYDAEKSTVSHGYSDDDDGKEVAFEEHGEKLFAGRDSVINGEFTINISMPTEITNNYRPATLNLYAQADNGMEAIGCNHSFYVYGFDAGAEVDTIAPQIEYFYINHDGFDDGDVVNESPMIIAQISDNVGINLSTAGVGHQMTLRLDGEKSYNDVSLYYTPTVSEIPSGVINYPIENLPDGKHEIRLKVWDTSGNSAAKTLTLEVKNGAVPNLFDVYTDANPAYTEANFFIKHDRPDAMATVTIEVYNLMGSLVWSSTKTARSDMFVSSPINWNLCDNAGRRVNRGIYVYRASMSTDGIQFSSAARKIAVGAQ